MMARVSSKFLKTLLPVALAIGALSYLHGLIQEMLPCRCEGRAERGDSANSLNAQRRTAAQVNLQAGMRKQA